MGILNNKYIRIGKARDPKPVTNNDKNRDPKTFHNANSIWAALYQSYQKEDYNPEKAARNSVVDACINYCVNAILDTEFILVKDGDETFTPVDHPVMEVIKRPNNRDSSVIFWDALLRVLYLCGAGFIVPTADMFNPPGIQVIPLYATRKYVYPDPTNNFFELYNWWNAWRPDDHDLIAEIIWRYRADSNEFAESPLRSVAPEIALGNDLATVSRARINTPVLGLILERLENDNVGPLTGEDLKALKDILSDAKDPDKIGMTFAPGGWKATEMRGPAHDFDYSLLWSYIEERICAIFGLPREIIGLAADSTGMPSMATAMVYERKAWSNGIIPLMRRLEIELTHHILPWYDGTEGLRFKFVTETNERLSEEDKATRATRYATFVNAGIMKPEDVPDHVKDGI